MTSITVISYDCVADCFYCGNESGSENNGLARLSPEDVSWWVEVSDVLRKTPQGRKLGFSDNNILSGGEATLPKNLPALKTAVSELLGRGLLPTINSNAWFAGTVESAGKMLAPFSQEGGRPSWNVSTGEGHMQKIPARNVANFFSASTDAGVPDATLTALYTKRVSAEQVLSEICASSPEGYSISYKEASIFVKSPSGKGEVYRVSVAPAGQFGRGKGNSGLYPASARNCHRNPTFSPDKSEPGLAHVYPCCSFGGGFSENRALEVRSGKYPSPELVLDALSSDAVSYGLAKDGLARTAQILNIAGFPVPFFENVCDLCYHLKATVPKGTEIYSRLNLAIGDC